MMNVLRQHKKKTGWELNIFEEQVCSNRIIAQLHALKVEYESLLKNDIELCQFQRLRTQEENSLNLIKMGTSQAKLNQQNNAINQAEEKSQGNWESALENSSTTKEVKLINRVIFLTNCFHRHI